MKSEKNKPSKTPGTAVTESCPHDDFTLCASLYYDAVYFYSTAQNLELNENFSSSERFTRAALLTIFSFFEAQVNPVAFGHAEAHKDRLPAFELDILEEKETKLNSDGTIQRNNKYYSMESRFRFLTLFLSGKPFDCSGKLWADFRKAQDIRNQWVHPKPPFNTWGLSLSDVK